MTSFDEDEVTTPLSRMRDNAGKALAVLLAVLLVVPAGAWLADELAFRRAGDEVAEAAPALADAVVLISNLACDGRNGTGSGFATELDGRPVVLTNRHVVEGASRVSLRTLDGDPGPSVTAVLLSDDDDVAVLELDAALPSSLALAPAPVVDDPVRLVGFPGARPITSSGEVDEVGGARLLLSMQVDGGASGAPVVDADDRVVAQVVARTPEGAGVAIPAPVVARAAAGARPAPGC